MNFDHVTDHIVKTFLTGEYVDAESAVYTLRYTDEALEADADNEDVSFELWNIRASYVDNAWYAFRYGADKDVRLNLQMFWNT